MDHICIALPILDGKTQDARDFMEELENSSRMSEYDRSERQIGITKEIWFLAALPSGDHLIGYAETEDFENALKLFSQSQDEFDLWFKKGFADVTGLDLNNPPPDFQIPELLSLYDAEMMAVGD